MVVMMMMVMTMMVMMVMMMLMLMLLLMMMMLMLILLMLMLLMLMLNDDDDDDDDADADAAAADDDADGDVDGHVDGDHDDVFFSRECRGASCRESVVGLQKPRSRNGRRIVTLRGPSGRPPEAGPPPPRAAPEAADGGGADLACQGSVRDPPARQIPVRDSGTNAGRSTRSLARPPRIARRSSLTCPRPTTWTTSTGWSALSDTERGRFGEDEQMIDARGGVGQQ